MFLERNIYTCTFDLGARTSNLEKSVSPLLESSTLDWPKLMNSLNYDKRWNCKIFAEFECEKTQRREVDTCEKGVYSNITKQAESKNKYGRRSYRELHRRSGCFVISLLIILLICKALASFYNSRWPAVYSSYKDKGYLWMRCLCIHLRIGTKKHCKVHTCLETVTSANIRTHCPCVVYCYFAFSVIDVKTVN